MVRDGPVAVVGKTRVRNRSTRLELAVLTNHQAILSLFRLSVIFFFILFKLVFAQSGSRLVAASLPYPQIIDLLPVKISRWNSYLQDAATTLLPQMR